MLWCRQRYKFEHTNGEKGWSPTSGFYSTFHSFFGIYGFSAIVRAICRGVLGKPFLSVLESSLNGVAWLTPLLVMMVVGRSRLFNYVAERFERDRERIVQDGAFIAELLSYATLEVNQAWWVHRELDKKDHSYLEIDHRHHWKLGSIVEVGLTEFAVAVPEAPIGPWTP